MIKLDLIIPTHNRVKYLKRVLDYYQQYGRDFNFIVADSSNSKIKALNRKLVSNYLQLRIRYVDKFSQNLNQHIKFAEMVKYAKSKYLCFCPDDDFIVPNGIKECVDFLEKNPDFSAAHGRYIGFYVHKNLFGSRKFWWQYRYSPHTISSANPLDRVASHLKDFTLVLWSVRRTDVVKKSYKDFLNAKIDPYLLIILGELLPDILTAMFGKIKLLNTFYSARQFVDSIAYDFASLIDAKNTGKYNAEYEKIKECLLNNLAKINNTPLDKASRVIDSSMDAYIKSSYQEHLTNNIYFKLRHFPRIITRWIRLLHIMYLFSKKKIAPIGDIDNPSSTYFNDFDNIRRNVLEHSMQSE